MGRNVAEVVEAVGVRVPCRHREYLFVGRAPIDEMEEADRARVHQAAGEYGDRHQHEHVQWITVVAEGTGEEAVVSGVVDGAVEHAVEPENTQRLVELVLVPLVGGNLDDGGHQVRRVGPGGDIVPGVQAGRSSGRHGQSRLKSEEVYPSGGGHPRWFPGCVGWPSDEVTGAGPEWRNGRRSGLKIHRGQPRASSNLASGMAAPNNSSSQSIAAHSAA